MFKIREDLTQHWFQPRITWNGAELIRKGEAASAVEKIPQKYDKKPEDPPLRTGTSTSEECSRGARPKTPRAPVDKKKSLIITVN